MDRAKVTGDEVRRFLAASYGSGSGDGDGSGYGDGYGSGDGYGDGYGVLRFCGDAVWHIDGVATIVRSLHRNYARGMILNRDLTTKPCYVARVGDYFAHGDTLHEAMRDAAAKDMERRSVSERVAMFVKAHPDPDAACDGRELYDWHHILTGSCKAGRDAWCADHGMSPDATRLTPREFLRLTKDSYGSEVIRRVAEAYNLEGEK